MLKKLFPVLVALSAIVPANAQTYNMTTSDVTVASGSDAVITVNLENSVDVRDMQLYLTLPENVVVPKDEYNEYKIAIDADRTPKHTPTCNYDEGMFKMAIASVTGRAIEAGTGPVAYITIHVDCAAGVYPFSFSEVHLSRIDDGNNAVDIPIADFGANITVTEAEDVRYGENQLYAKDVTISEGENAVLLLAYNSNSDVYGFSTDITFPEGIEVTNVEYEEVLTSMNFNITDWVFANQVLTLKGSQSGTNKNPKLADAGNQLFARVSLTTSTLSADTYNIVVGNQYLSNSDEEKDGEYNPEAYTAYLTVRGSTVVSDLVDGVAYTNTEDYVGDITYKRTFKSANWHGIYLPFEMNYEEWSEYGDMYKINNVHQYDRDNDGVLDYTTIEFNKMESGSTQAHTPYVFKPKETCVGNEITFSCKDRTLYAAPAEDRSINCSTTEMVYNLYGTYTVKEGLKAQNAYAISPEGVFVQAKTEDQVLNPFRIYLIITPKNEGGYGSSSASMPQKVIISVDGENLSSVGELWGESNEESEIFFDLTGRKIQNPTNGIYIKNGKKVLIK